MIEAEIVKVDQDEQGALRLWACYKKDGVEVQSNYPKIDGKSVYCTRYDSIQFVKMTDQEIKAHILAQSQAHVESLIRKEYAKLANADVVARVSDMVGQKLSASTVKISVSPTEEVVIGMDGTKGEITTKVVAEEVIK